MRIFCAESLWDKNLSNKRSSVKPILELLSTQYNVEYSHHTFHTSEELGYLFTLFGKSKYEIMYLTSHMEYGFIKSGYNSEFRPFLRTFIDKYDNILRNKVLHLAGCSSLSPVYLDLDHIRNNSRISFLSGYTLDTDWDEGIVTDYLYFCTLQYKRLSDVPKFMHSNYSQLINRTGFKMYNIKGGLGEF